MSKATLTPPPRPTRRSGIVVPEKVSLRGKVLSTAIYLLARLLMASWRVRVRDDAGVTRPGFKGPCIFALWHNRLGICMEAWTTISKANPEARLGALISASKDGGLLAATLAKFGVQAIRGSSSRRGAQAILELTTWIQNGGSVAITPDGPRGPRYSVKDGVIALAQITDAPIVPVGATIHFRKTTRSWDQFQIPLPFSRIELNFGTPIVVTSESDRVVMGERLTAALLQLGND
ncbi:MAG TPA: lysophospholipid acyltransferase family protein [Methylomirabilota bacterium]|nr:lysophospholipid acyltransferase family protein [Methylomirabilota bacterium]